MRSNYIFIHELTPGFNGLDKDNYKTSQELFKFCDLVRLILKILQYIWGTLGSNFQYSSFVWDNGLVPNRRQTNYSNQGYLILLPHIYVTRSKCSNNLWHIIVME